MSVKLTRKAYAKKYGPTDGDRIRLADTELVIQIEEHYGDYGFMKHPHIRTPNLDKLAGESLVFENGFVPTSLCRASLATMITGLEPQQHKMWR